MVSLDWPRWSGVTIGICVAGLCCAQAPSFQAKSVVAGDRVVPLRSGLIMSIYGEHLGPVIGCAARAMSVGYPRSLCNTRVLVGGVPAELLYVADRQINFRVPQAAGFEGSVRVMVIYKNKSSRGVSMPLGLESATVSLESPASVGGPVWLKVSKTSWEYNVHYPFQIWPASFGCFQIELLRNGKIVVPAATFETQVHGGITQGGLGPCGALGLPGE